MKKILITILILLTILFTTLLYSRFIGIKGLKTNEIVLKEPIDISYNGLKIIHFADIHYKKIIGEKEIKKLVKEINRINPDIIFFTGDLIDNEYQLKNKDINFLIKELSKIDNKYGFYAILGDQDKKEKETIKNIYLQSNITLLENETITIQNEQNAKILVSVIDNKSKNIIPKENNYHIVLTHEPDNTDKILKENNNVSLILSAHSINGSINLPIIKKILLPKGAKKYYKPFYQINNTKLYITNGIGLNNINFRLWNKPSINFYRIQKQ